MMTLLVFVSVLVALLAAGLGWRIYQARQRARRRTLRQQRHSEQQKAWESLMAQRVRRPGEGQDRPGD